MFSLLQFKSKYLIQSHTKPDTINKFNWQMTQNRNQDEKKQELAQIISIRNSDAHCQSSQNYL